LRSGQAIQVRSRKAGPSHLHDVPLPLPVRNINGPYKPTFQNGSPTEDEKVEYYEIEVVSEVNGTEWVSTDKNIDYCYDDPTAPAVRQDAAPAAGESAVAAQGAAAHTVGDAAVLAETDVRQKDAAPAAGESAAAA